MGYKVLVIQCSMLNNVLKRFVRKTLIKQPRFVDVVNVASIIAGQDVRESLLLPLTQHRRGYRGSLVVDGLKGKSSSHLDAIKPAIKSIPISRASWLALSFMDRAAVLLRNCFIHKNKALSMISLRDKRIFLRFLKNTPASLWLRIFCLFLRKVERVEGEISNFTQSSFLGPLCHSAS